MAEENLKITMEMTIERVISSFPSKAQKLVQLLTGAGLHCMGCHAATWETLEAGMYSHEKSEEEIHSLVDKLNALLEEEEDLTTVVMTLQAAKKFLAILEEEEKQGWGLRFDEKLAGCNGYEYILDYAENPDPEKDEIFVSHGVEIYVEKIKVKKMLGSEIDYVDGLQGGGFKISNPNVSSSCGCGSSHNYSS